MRRISITQGFITNSSSVVHHFDNKYKEHPDVKAFIEIHGIENGFVSSDMWNRPGCTTVAWSKEQKAEAKTQLVSSGYDGYENRGPRIDVDSENFVVIYGDEYTTVASELRELIDSIMCKEEGKDFHSSYGDDFN